MPKPSIEKVDRPHGRTLLPPRLGVWSAAPKPLRFSQREIPKSVRAFAMLALFASLFAGSFSHSLVPLVLRVYVVAVGVWAVFKILWLVNEGRARRSTSRDQAFSDAPSGIEEFPVELTLHNVDGTYATDRGVAWFEDGILTFVGACCSFALAAEDIVPKWGPKGRDLYRKLPGDMMRLSIPGRDQAIRLRPLLGPRALAFRFRLGRFLVGGTSSSAPRQWPPLESYDVAKVDERRLRRSNPEGL